MKLINNAMSGLLANKTALGTVSQNTANSSIPGYSRQQPQFATTTTGSVYISNIKRASDSYLAALLKENSTNIGFKSSYYQGTAQIESILNSKGNSVSSGLREFFNALQTASSAPSSKTSRQTVLNKASDLSARFNDLNNQLNKQSGMANTRIAIVTENANGLTQQISAINKDIAQSSTSGLPPNKLLDDRDRLINQLSELVDTQINYNKDGSVDIFLQQGQPLVIRGKANKLELHHADTKSNLAEIKLKGESATYSLKNIGGRLGGVLKFQHDVVAPNLRKLGQIAVVTADAINKQLKAGVDLKSNEGSPLFSDINHPDLISNRYEPSGNNKGNAKLDILINDTSKLKANDYSLIINKGDNGDLEYSLISKGNVVSSGPAIDLDSGIEVDGLSIKVSSGNLAEGDSFGVDAISSYAASMKTIITDTDKLAFSKQAGETSDNGNLLKLIKLQTKQLVDGKTIDDGWKEVVTGIANETSHAEGSFNAAKALYDAANSDLLSHTGVDRG